MPASLVMAFILGALLLRPRTSTRRPPSRAASPTRRRPPTPKRPARTPRGGAERAAQPADRDRGAVHRPRRLLQLPGAARRGRRPRRPLPGAQGAPRRGRGLLGAGPDQRPLHRLLPARRRGAEPGEERRAADRGPHGARSSACRSTSTRSTRATSTASTTSSPPTPTTRAARRRTSRRCSAPTPTCSGSATASTPFIGVLAEAARPGPDPALQQPEVQAAPRAAPGIAITWPRPVIAKRGTWEDDEKLEPGDTADVTTSSCPPGGWDLSFQYSSEVRAGRAEGRRRDLRDAAGGRGRDPVPAERGTVLARRRDRLGRRADRARGDRQGALAPSSGWSAPTRPSILGNLAATRLEDRGTLAFKASCKRYIDHYYLGAPGSLQGSKESGGGRLNLQPTR